MLLKINFLSNSLLFVFNSKAIQHWGKSQRIIFVFFFYNNRSPFRGYDQFVCVSSSDIRFCAVFITKFRCKLCLYRLDPIGSIVRFW